MCSSTLDWGAVEREMNNISIDKTGMGQWGFRVPNIFKCPRKLVKNQQCCKRVGRSIFCDFFKVAIVGQFVKIPFTIDQNRTEGNQSDTINKITFVGVQATTVVLT